MFYHWPDQCHSSHRCFVVIRYAVDLVPCDCLVFVIADINFLMDCPFNIHNTDTDSRRSQKLPRE